MFESLDDQMKLDAQETSSPRERAIKWILTGIGAVLLFGGLYMGIRLLE